MGGEKQGGEQIKMYSSVESIQKQMVSAYSYCNLIYCVWLVYLGFLHHSEGKWRRSGPWKERDRHGNWEECSEGKMWRE